MTIFINVIGFYQRNLNKQVSCKDKGILSISFIFGISFPFFLIFLLLEQFFICPPKNILKKTFIIIRKFRIVNGLSYMRTGTIILCCLVLECETPLLTTMEIFIKIIFALSSFCAHFYLQEYQENFDRPSQLKTQILSHERFQLHQYLFL